MKALTTDALRSIKRICSNLWLPVHRTKSVSYTHLGDVMKESAQAALSCVQSVAGEYGIESDWFETHDIHIHIPEGAVPKDGPSAGITMATAILSAVTNRAVRPDVAMTGEITLRGRVLAIGGLKEKLLAAKAAGATPVSYTHLHRVHLAF